MTETSGDWKKRGDDVSPLADLRLLAAGGVGSGERTCAPGDGASPWEHPACSWVLALNLPSDLHLVSQVDFCPGQDRRWTCHAACPSSQGSTVCQWK